MRRKAEPIETVLSRTIERLRLSRRLREADAVRIFKEVVGAEIAQQAEAVKIVNGKLYVRVESPTWRQELDYRKVEIAALLNQALGETVVSEVFFTG
ncbi:MAG: DUF721 domain-containing protein [candidate division Zixibacteria bacterium]|nr:DUF721 domain-containing protein [candidate division Zixibacteria bacterium]